MNGIPYAQQSAERAVQKGFGIKDSWTAKYVQLKAEEQIMEYPDATWNDFLTHNIQEDVMLQVSSIFLHVVEHIKNELVRKRQEMRNLRTELQEHRVICMEGNFRPWAPTQKANQKTVRFCNSCQKKRAYTKMGSQRDAWRRITESASRYVLQQEYCSHTGIGN